MTSTLRFIRPSAIQIAEYWDWDRALPVTPVPAGLGFDVALGDAFRDAVRSLLTQAAAGEGAQLQLDPVASALARPAGYDAAWRLMQCLENHDLTYLGHDGAARVPALADPTDHRSWYARSRSRAAAALLFAAPGIPALFMGQEILEDKLWCDDERDHPGHLIWWDGLGSDKTMSDYRRFMRDIISLRRAQPALSADGARKADVRLRLAAGAEHGERRGVPLREQIRRQRRIRRRLQAGKTLAVDRGERPAARGVEQSDDRLDVGARSGRTVAGKDRGRFHGDAARRMPGEPGQGGVGRSGRLDRQALDFAHPAFAMRLAQRLDEPQRLEDFRDNVRVDQAHVGPPSAVILRSPRSGRLEGRGRSAAGRRASFEALCLTAKGLRMRAVEWAPQPRLRLRGLIQMSFIR